MPEMTIIKPGYKKTAVGVIPEDWDCLKIKDVLKDSFLGGNYNNTLEKEFCSEKIPLIKMGNIDRGKIDIKTFYSIDDDVQIDEKHRLNKGDVLFNTRNTLELVGKVAIWNNEYPLAYFNSNLLKLVFQKNKVINSFANLTLNSQKGLRQLKSVATGTTSVAAIYDRDLRNLKLPIPPLPEQKAIADCLSTWDKAIEKQTQLIEAKKEFKKGLMQGFFSGQLTVENGQIIKAKKGEDFTEDWEEVILDEVFDFYPNASYSRDEEIENGEIQHIHYGDIHTKYNFNLVCDQTIPKLDKSKLKNYETIQVGDLILADTSEDYEGVGKSIEILKLSNYPMIAGLHTFHLRPKTKNFALGFLGYLVSCDSIKKQFHRLATGIKVFSLSKSVLKTVVFPLPPIDVQSGFANLLQLLEKEIELEEKKLIQLQIQKKGLMQVLLNGEKRLITKS